MLTLSLFFFYILLTGKQNNKQRQDETDVSGPHYNSDRNLNQLKTSEQNAL